MTEQARRTGCIVLCCTPDGLFQAASQSFPECLGYAAKELHGATVNQLLHEESPSPFKACPPSELLFMSRQADVVTLRLTERYAMTDGGVVLRLEDSSHSTPQGTNLAQSEEAYYPLLQESFEALLVIDPHSDEVLAANTSACSMFGASLEHLRTLRGNDLLAPEDDAPLGGSRSEGRRLLRRLGSSTFRAHVSVLPYHTQDGSARSTVVVRDLTEREESRRSHLEAYEAISQIVDQAPAMMATLKGPEHVITRANQRYLRTLGLRDIVGKRVIDVLPEIQAQGIIDILDGVYASGEPFTAQEFPTDLSVNGALTRFYFDVVYQPIRNLDGTISGILANATNVTEKVESRAQLEQLNQQLRDAYDATIEGWARALDLKDEDTAGHSRRVTHWTAELALELGTSGEELEHVRRGALLHDIGKMAVPDEILLKPGALTAEEWEIIKGHTNYARELLKPIAFLHPALDIAVHHHERWDGTGYPDGLAGEAIPLAARIFAVIDVFDALTSDRPYRAAWSAHAALDHLRSEAGKHFDPRVVEAFQRVVEPHIDMNAEGRQPLHPDNKL